jgi:hypothetical protein
MALWQRSVVWVSSKDVKDSNPLNWAPVDDLSRASMLANPPSGGAKYITSDCTRVFASIFDPYFGVSALDPAQPDGGWQPVLASATKEAPVYSLAADEAYVYVGYAGQGGLDRVDVKARQLEHNFHGYSVWGIALDDEAIYFGDHGEDGRLSGEILRITK